MPATADANLEKQLRRLAKDFGWSLDAKTPVTIRDHEGEDQTSLLSLFELVDENDELQYRAILFNDEDGRVFAADTTRVVAEVSQGGLDSRAGAKETDRFYDVLGDAIDPKAAEKRKKALAATANTAPPDVKAWRAAYPDPEAQRTCDLIAEALADAHKKVLGGFLEIDTGLRTSKQPKEPYAWLSIAKQAWFKIGESDDNVRFSNVQPFEVFRQLRKLSLDVAAGTDLSPLARLTNLRHLTLGVEAPVDLGFIQKLWKLGRLTINLKGPLLALRLGALEHLKKLELRGSFSEMDIEFPPHLLELQINAYIRDVRPIAGVKTLGSLDLSSNEIADISPLFSLPQLGNLEVEKNRITSIEGIEALSNTSVELAWNCISDFEPARRWLKPEEADEWVEQTAPTQLDLGSQTGQALRDDWHNLDKWAAHASFLEQRGDASMAKNIQLRLADPEGRDSDLPWHWARVRKMP